MLLCYRLVLKSAHHPHFRGGSGVWLEIVKACGTWNLWIPSPIQGYFIKTVYLAARFSKQHCPFRIQPLFGKIWYFNQSLLVNLYILQLRWWETVWFTTSPCIHKCCRLYCKDSSCKQCQWWVSNWFLSIILFYVRLSDCFISSALVTKHYITLVNSWELVWYSTDYT